MKFIELQGVIINLDAVKLCQKALDKSKIKNMLNEETGEKEEVIEGKPFLITLDLGDSTVINMTYSTRDERDQNFNLCLDIFQARTNPN